MPLEDFFTLGEMRDGLSSLSRVEELVSVIEKQKDCVSCTADDRARQWSAVAGTLAATENKDCLVHFAQLNGLCFLNEWFQEAQKCTNDISANAVEELINALLVTLERVPIDKEKANACGLGITVEQLLSHENIKIKDRARLLFDKLKKVMVDEAGLQDQEKSMTCLGPNDQLDLPTDSNSAQKGLCSGTVSDISLCKREIGERCYEAESTGIESHHSNVTRFTDGSQEGTTNCGDVSKSNQLAPATSSTSVGAVGDMTSLGSSLVSNSCHENLSVTDESSVCPATESASAGTCSSPSRKTKDDSQHHVPMFKDVNGNVVDMDAEVNKMETFLHNGSKKQSSCLSATTSVAATESQPCKIDSKGTESCISNSADLQADTGVGDHKPPEHLKIDSSETSFLSKEVESDSDAKESDSDAEESDSDTKDCSSDVDLKLSRGVNLLIATDSYKVETKATGELDQESVMGLEYEEIDALEVARLVAIEVEREVVDYREPFCSSPEANSGETVVKTPVPTQDMQDQPSTEDGNRLPTENNVSDSVSFQKDNTRIPEDKPDEHELRSVAQDLDGGKYYKSRVIIDLNEDICINELDTSPRPTVPVNVSTPIAVIATSRAGLPVTPLHFEGELGWRGSAATSAFRPASPRRNPDADKSSSILKQKPNFLGFDLNVAGSEDVVEVDPTGTRQMHVSSGLPFGEPVGISSRRREKLQLDLNRLGNEDPSVYPSSNWRIPCQGGDQSLYSASSSCSKQPSILDFDLNDNPPFFDACSSSYEIGKTSRTRDDPVVMAMDSSRKEYSRLSFMSREPLMPGGPMISYPHIMHAPYGYNGLVDERPMLIPPPPYGPASNVPYQLVDSRRFTSVTPQFLMSSSGAPSTFNGVGPLRPGFDLNSGMTTTVDMASRELSLFMQGHGDVIEGQARTSSHSQPSNSGMPLKRKELDRGQDSYPLSYKQLTSWRR